MTEPHITDGLTTLDAQVLTALTDGRHATTLPTTLSHPDSDIRASLVNLAALGYIIAPQPTTPQRIHPPAILNTAWAPTSAGIALRALLATR